MSSRLPVVLEAKSPIRGVLFILHGLGDSGHGWEPVAREFRRDSRFDCIKIILPHAPVRPITINGGMPMPGWYDLASLDANREDFEGVKSSRTLLRSLIDAEMKSNSLPASSVFLMGFSQGAAMSLFTGFTSDITYGCIVSLSGYLPCAGKFAELVNPKSLLTPTLFCHGLEDDLVNVAWGKKSMQLVKGIGANPEWLEYRHLSHSTSEEEIGDVKEFLLAQVAKLVKN